MTSPFARALAVIFILIVAGCNTVPSVTQQTKNEKQNEQAVDTAKDSLDKVTNQINELKTTIIDNNKATIDALKGQKDAASGSVYAAKAANNENPAKNKFTAAVTAELGLAEAALGGPSSGTLAEANKTLQLLLSESQAQRDQAQALLEAKKEELGRLQNKVTEAEAKSEKAGIDLTHAQDSAKVAGDNLNKAEEKFRRDEHDWAEKWKGAYAKLDADQKLRSQLEFYFYLACIATAIGAVAAFRFYPPVCIPLGLASVGFFFAAFLVATLPLWGILLILLGVALAFVWAFYIKHQRLAAIADNAIGAIGELKNRASDGDPDSLSAYAELRKHLVDWFGERGHALESELEGRLRKLNLIGQTPQVSLAPSIRALSKRQHKDRKPEAVTPPADDATHGTGTGTSGPAVPP